MFAGLFGSGSQARDFSSRSASHGGQSGGPAYSFARFQQLYDRLSRFKESDLEKSGGGDAVVETVRQITEALIWGEQNNAQFFDFFCEKSILADFVRVLGLPKTPKKVKLQLLQTLQMLVQNIRQKTSVYYLLSNNHVNRLIKTQFDFSDEEVLAYYITLMKSLAMRLDTETIKFFFIQRSNETTFPLYTEATKFFSHRDQMVRATVRTITLQVYRIQDEPMQHFVLRHAAELYFSQLALHLRDLWLRLDVAVAGASGERDLASIQGENELQQDLQIYLSDVFELEVAALNEVLADRLLNCVMLPVLLAGIARAQGAEGTGGDRDAVAETQRVLAPAVALFLLRQVLDTFRSPVLLEPLLSALLRPQVQAALAYVLPQCADTAAPSATSTPDFVPNSIRRHFLAFVSSGKEAHTLLSAAILHGCVLNRAAAPRQLLEVARVLPHDAARTEGDAASGGDDQAVEAGDCEVLLLMLQALRCQSSWQVDATKVYISIVLDIFLEASLNRCAKVWTPLVRSVQSCAKVAASRLMELLQEASILGGSGTDGLLDVFAEEWEAHQALWPDIPAFCGNPRRLLPCPLRASPRCSVSGGEGSRPPCSGDDEARRAIAAFLLLRRLLPFLERPTAEAAGPQGARSRPWSGCSDEPTPLQLDDQTSNVIGEGMSFAIGNIEKIVCGVASPNGKCTRYLLLHDYWLLLVQPDLAAPGWAVAKTVRPIWQVQSLADRSDPRTLQLGLCALSGNKKNADGAVEVGGDLVTMSLNFEDVKRAHTAAEHLQMRRRDVRVKLMHKAAAFVGAWLARLPPGEEEPPGGGGSPSCRAAP